MDPRPDRLTGPGVIQNQVNGPQVINGGLHFSSPPPASAELAVEQSGTCQWLLRHREWKRWLSARGGLMWIKGKPGSGKSTLLWYAEQELKNTTVKKKDIVLSFFFHGRGEQLQRSPLGMYRALLHQLLKQEPASLSHLVEAFQHQAAGKDNEDIAWNRDIGNLGNFLENAIYTILASRTVWLFVDALDECGREGAGDVLQRFNRLGRPGLFICISCRHYPLHHWDGGFEVTVEEQNKADILRYAQSQLSGLEGKTSFSVPDVISTRSTGLFIWARLAVERLRNIDVEFWGDAVEEDIRRVIESIPHDLEDLYTGIVREIGKIPAALKMLRWISCAQRPLLLDELRWAFIVDLNAHANHQFFSLSECEATAMRDARCPKSDRDMEAMVKAFGRGLLETVGSASGRIVVQFIHQTVMEFFRQGGLLLLDDDNKESTEDAVDAAHDHLLRTCIAFLKMHEAGRQRDLDPNVPFLVYATQFWVEHASSSRKGQAKLLEYLNWPSDPFVRYWEEYYTTLEKHLTGPDCPPPGIELVHVLARYGLVAPLSTIVGRTEKPNLDAADSLDRTPLMYAAERGQISVVKTLIRAGARTQAADCIGATPLHWAALRGHTEIMTLLLENGAKSGARVRGRCTPLAWALEGGSEAGVKLLLEDCDVELLDAEYILPHTARKPRFTMDDFVQASVDFYFVGDVGNMFEVSWRRPCIAPWIWPREPCRVWKEDPPWWFKFLGPFPDRFHLPAMGFLPGVPDSVIWNNEELDDIEKVLRGSSYGHRTLLLRAVELGRRSIVRKLLEKGASPYLKGTHGWTPLQLAMRKADTELVGLLKRHI